MDINYIAVVAGTVIFFLIGAAWYGIFSKPWLDAIGKKQAELKGMKNMPTDWFPFVLSFVLLFILNYVLAFFVGKLGYTTALEGAMFGLSMWGGFTATVILINMGYEDRKWSIFFINGGYFLVGTVISGILLTLWR